eukprot:TRINITY_DN3018_c0_g1_i3.p1 TRINITY_DN3018_c0_g1~~TRINITY_DN3018_c0_g1_i3.p1  ORF type:complete len:753 (+),score=184.94 TRINITY_DN3018_c0_g1_i3:53-2260(+)
MSGVLWVVAAMALGQGTCPTAPAVPEDRRANKNKAIICSYNLKWLFDGVNDRVSPWDVPQAEAHIVEVAAGMDQVNADVYILEEVEDCTVVEAMRKKMTNGDDYKVYIVKGTDSYTGQDVALLTKIDPIIDLYRSKAKEAFPVTGGTCSSPSSPGTTGVSKHLATKIQLRPNLIVGIVGVHLLAWPTDKTRCSKREAQAKVIAAIATEVSIGAQGVMVMGDFNDYSGTLLDVKDHIPVSRTLEIIKEATTPPMHEAAVAVAKADRSTHGTGSLGSMIDHVLMSQSLVPYIESVAILHNITASDHFPVVVVLNFETPVPDTATPTAAPTPAPDTSAPATPATDVPATNAPATDAPATGAPATDAPATDAPATPEPVTPVTSAPSTDAPATDAPATGAPDTTAPVTNVPITSAPDTSAPVTVAPRTAVPGSPVTEAPDTPVPVTAAPVTTAPVTTAPATNAPDTKAPGTLAPATAAPATGIPGVPPTTAPSTAMPTSSPSTNPPVTAAPTSAPSTNAPATGIPGVPTTPAPDTMAPKTSAPLTQAPVTPAPATGIPGVPPTPAPDTVAPTSPPVTAAPATGIPGVPPTPAPDTVVPTVSPATGAPSASTLAPNTTVPATGAPVTDTPKEPNATNAPATPEPELSKGSTLEPTPVPDTAESSKWWVWVLCVAGGLLCVGGAVAAWMKHRASQQIRINDILNSSFGSASASMVPIERVDSPVNFSDGQKDTGHHPTFVL